MGGTIALHLAAGHRVDGLVTICTPLVFDLKFYTTRTASLFLNFKSETKQNIKNPAARKDHIAYSSVPPGAFFQLLALLGATRSRLDRITVPVLLFQSSDDRIVSPTNAPYLYRQLTGTDKKELVWLNNSGHMATLDYDKTIIFENTLRLIKEI